MLKLSHRQSFKIISALFLSVAVLFLAQGVVSADITNPVIGELGTSEDTSTGGKFIQYAVYLWRASITLGSLAVILYFLLGAFGWITAAGDKGKIEEARNKMTNSIIGLVLLVSSFVLLGFMSKLLFGDNFNLLKLTIPGVGVTESQANTPTDTPFIDGQRLPGDQQPRKVME